MDVAAPATEGTPRPERVPAWRIALFMLAGAACASPWASPPVALVVGMALALLGLATFEGPSKRLSRLLIQVCVTLLGFRIDLHELFRRAGEGFPLAAGTIAGTMALGLLLGRALRVGREVNLLTSSGTAICGGSAIAAVGAAIRATSSQMAVATGAIFLLNALALLVFPPIGHALHMTPTQFGTWAGVAIHDISSVVGAAEAFDAGGAIGAGNGAGAGGHAALDTANIVKLSRVLWIFPIALFASWWMGRAEVAAGGTASRPRVAVPWFILTFLAASGVRTLVPALAAQEAGVIRVAGLGFQLALFLIGAGLSRAAIASVGWRTLVQAAVLWVCVAGASLAVIRAIIE